MLCLLKGDVRESLRFNAMALPISAMLAATLLVGASRFRTTGRLTLPKFFFPMWIGLLLVAWAMKLFGSPEYW